MKALKILFIVIVVVLVIVAGVLFFLTRFVQTPEFRDRLLAAVHESTGMDVKVGEMKVSIFSGIDLKDVAIKNPEGFSGNFVTAKAFALHYRLLPLLSRRVEVETLTLDSPVITLAKNDNGDWNYEKPKTEGKGTKDKPVEKSTPKESSAKGGSLDIAVSKIEMKNAALVMMDKSGKELLRIADLDLSSSVDLNGDKLSGSGKASIGLVNAANKIFVHGLSAPVSLGEAIKISPLSGKVADGSLSGEAGLVGPKYSVNAQIKDADVVKLIQEAGAKKVFSSGKLQLTTALTGTGGLETINGSGKVEITGGQLVDVPILNLLATLLQISALNNLKFDQCVLEYTIADNVMQTPVINLKSPQVQITGNGSVQLSDYSLNHTLTLALAKGTLESAPEEVRKLFQQREDGSYAIEFKVTGPYDHPKTDLQMKLLKGVGEQLLEKGLKKYLK